MRFRCPIFWIATLVTVMSAAAAASKNRPVVRGSTQSINTSSTHRLLAVGHGGMDMGMSKGGSRGKMASTKDSAIEKDDYDEQYDEDDYDDEYYNEEVNGVKGYEESKGTKDDEDDGQYEEDEDHDPKGTKADGADDNYDDEENDDDDVDSKGMKLDGGSGKTTSGKKGGGSKKGGSKNGADKKGGKDDEDTDDEGVETYRRSTPVFSIQYKIAGPMRRSTPDIGDYNELSVTSEYFFDSFFRSIFEDLQVNHDSTIVHVMLNDDEPFKVDFLLGFDFVIPGEVPTVPFLLDWVEEAFEREASINSYLWDLREMSDTNPFSATESFEIVHEIPQEAVGFSDGPGGPFNNQGPAVESTGDKQKVMITFISGIGFLVLVLVGLLWVRQRRYNSQVVYKEEDETAFNFSTEKDGYKDENDSENESERFPSHEEDAVQYLDTIRKRYKDDEDAQTVKTAFEDVDVDLPEERSLDRIIRPAVHHGLSFEDVPVRQNSDPRSGQNSPSQIGAVGHHSGRNEDNLLEINLAKSQSKDEQEAPRTDQTVDCLNLALNYTSTEEEDLRGIY